jgi:uncharacterized repeat protein (TIGR01451 family)
MKKYGIILLMGLYPLFAQSQGWERVYGGGGFDLANAITETPDGGYALAGYYGLNRLFLVKIDANGNEQWARNYTDFGSTTANAIIGTKDSCLLSVGSTRTNQKNVYILKTDAYGNKLWSKSIGSNQLGQDEEAFDVIEENNGDLVVVGVESSKNNLFVTKLDGQGNTLWYKTYGTNSDKEQGFGICRTNNGDFIAVGAKNESLIYAIRISSMNGSLIWEKSLDIFQDVFDIARDVTYVESENNFVIAGFTNNSGLIAKINDSGSTVIWSDTIPQCRFYSISRAKEEGFYTAGQKDISAAQGELVIHRFAPDGSTLWQSTAGKGGPDVGYGILLTRDGGAIVSGSSSPDLTASEQRAYAVKTDSNGVILTSYLQGVLFWDNQVENCNREPNEPPLQNWVVLVEGMHDVTYAVTNENGEFNLLLDTGHYNLKVYRFSDYWETCSPITEISLPAFYDTVHVAIPIQTFVSCPRNEIDVATPVLRRCAVNEYVVRYCNTGTTASSGTYIKIIKDKYLEVTEASQPYFEQGDTLTFNVGLLQSGTCREFTFSAYLDCNETTTGSTHCVSAHIYPDTFCNVGNWDRSIIEASANCDSDSVGLYLKNIGIGDMSTTAEFVIAEDVIMLVQPGNPDFQYKLDAGELKKVWTGPKNGKTYRIIAQQTPGYPGISTPTAAVEGCVSDTTPGMPSIGFYTMFPNDDADAFISFHCQESQNPSFNPVLLKQGIPKGYDLPNYILPKTDLEYLISFSNEGNDTVQQVIIRDTLSAALNPASARAGSASHEYQFSIQENGILVFTMKNTNLPPGGIGFVKFRVAQKDSLPCGTKVLNAAGLFFDFNAPLLSNTTQHTICTAKDAWIIATNNIEWPNAQVKIYPNPFLHQVTFDFNGVHNHPFELTLLNNLGQLLYREQFSTPPFTLHRNQIPEGALYYLLTTRGKTIAGGKLIAQESN